MFRVVKAYRRAFLILYAIHYNQFAKAAFNPDYRFIIGEFSDVKNASVAPRTPYIYKVVV